MGSKSSSISVSMNWVISAFNIFELASTRSVAVALLIIGFSIATHHYYDAEVGGPLQRPSNDTFKKARSNFTTTGSPQKLQIVSVLSQSSRLVSLQNKTTESPTTSAYNHHVAREKLEEFTPFCAAVSINGALPTPSRLSESYLVPLSDVGRKLSARRRTQYEHRHTGMDYVVLRARRLGAA